MYPIRSPAMKSFSSFAAVYTKTRRAMMQINRDEDPSITVCVNMIAQPLLSNPRGLTKRHIAKILSTWRDSITVSISPESHSAESRRWLSFELSSNVMQPIEMWSNAIMVETMPCKVGIDVKQRLKLVNKGQDLNSIREFLLRNKAVNWIHHPRREDELSTTIPNGSGGFCKVIVFRYAGTLLYKAQLYLVSEGNDYNVTNIVPELPVREINYSEYNSLLQDFITSVLERNRSQIPYTVELSSPTQSIDDHVPINAAKALNSFSSLANRSTLDGHPCDSERWMKFIILVHRDRSNRQRLDPEFLKRWLHEIHRWNEEDSSELAGKYETALSLLRFYDSQAWKDSR